jgi:hypothetical protein
MISYLKKLFSNKKTEEENSYLIDISKEAFISFVLDENNKIVIRINFQNMNDDNCKKMAEVLYMINNGGYQVQLIEMLKEIAVKDPSVYRTVEKVFDNWKDYYDLVSVSNNSPCVSPCSFSKSLQKPMDHK